MVHVAVNIHASLSLDTPARSRTVADVGFVGFPNAGKSTLLRALSRAAPEVAPFPFTTLMPNLGAMGALPDEGGSSDQAGTRPTAISRLPPTVLADLPGLVQGAHQGKGLGRLFLRHLRRVRVVLYILDMTSAELTPSEQYDVLRRELHLYNPQYLDRHAKNAASNDFACAMLYTQCSWYLVHCTRPHIVCLNKLDVALDAGGEEAMRVARREGTRAIAASAAQASNQVSASLSGSPFYMPMIVPMPMVPARSRPVLVMCGACAVLADGIAHSDCPTLGTKGQGHTNTQGGDCKGVGAEPNLRTVPAVMAGAFSTTSSIISTISGPRVRWQRVTNRCLASSLWTE